MSLRASFAGPDWPRAPRLACAGLGGALAALGPAPFHLPPLALLGFLLLMVCASRAPSARAAGATGWIGATVYFAIVLHWIVEPFQVDAARHGWMAPFALVFLAGGLALFWALAAWGAHRLAPAPRARPVALALTLAAAELARAYVFTGFPWGLPASLWLTTPAAQTLAWLGPHGLTLLTLAGLALPLTLRPAPAVPALLLMPALLVGAGLMRAAPPEPAADAALVRLVQPNAPQDRKWDPDWAPLYFTRQLTATAAPAATRPDLIVWPETAVAARLSPDSAALAEITEAATGVPVVLGLNRWQGLRVFNSALVLDGAGSIAALYDKAHLVPFGEYVPFGDLMARFGIYGLAAHQGAGYSAGPGPRLIALPGIGPALPLICYEAIFPQFGRVASQDARVMLHLTNDAWFGAFAGPQQHLELARMRAIERGLPVIRVANTGISAVIDSAGRVTGSMALDTHGHLDRALPPRVAPTLYARNGDLPVLAGLVLALAGLGLALRPRRSAAKPD